MTATPGSEGLAFGNGEIWSGLAIILDSFDNNGLVSSALLPWQYCDTVFVFSMTTPRSWQ